MKKVVKIACILFAFSCLLSGCKDKSEKKDNNNESSSAPSVITTESTSTTAEHTTVILNQPTTTSAVSEETATSKSAETEQNKTSSSTKASVKSTQSTTKKKEVSSPTYIKGVLVANKTYELPSNYNPGVNPQAQSAFNNMSSAAAQEGINLYIVSGFRSYSTQASIYNNYVARDGKAAADRYSARPGHSEHQTGLAFDLNSLSQSFENTPEGKWLAANCYKYGFIIRYPKGKENITGYMYEPWHVRYLGTDTATKVYNSGLTLEEYLGIDSVYKY